ncbi:MAG: valine--tRNA ligase [Thermoproteota archaeon]
MSTSKNPKPKLEEKRWSNRLELETINSWHEKKLFRFNKNEKGEIYSIDTPPPYLSGRWHVGGAAHYVQQDMIARYKKLKGYNVLFSFGADRNGLPIEVMVERKENIRAKDIPREKFLELCKSYLDSIEKEVLNQVKLLGMSIDLENIYRTDSPEYRAITQATFIKLWNDGLIYEDYKPANWCPRCGTTLADAEIEYEELPTELLYIKFKVKETSEDIVIATTRPELLPACSAVIYNPEDKRYKRLSGLTAITPVFNNEVKIIPHPSADTNFGTGIVMICSYGDSSDVRLFRELKLAPKICINEDGTMNKNSGPLEGLSVKEAREKIKEILKEKGFLVKTEKIIHRTPTCWRCHTPIEIIVTKEFYLKQVEFKNELKKISDQIEFYPPQFRKNLYDWIDSVSEDWPISRRRYYATEIPVWYCKVCGEPYVPPPGRYYQPWKENPPAGAQCKKCGSKEFIGETRVLDTWMDSSISQLFIIGYGRDEDLFKKARPANLRPQGYEIIRTWLYYSILRTYLLLKDRAFRQVRISGMGVDEKGEAMHKSKGNVVYPEVYIEKYGSDAFRLWAASEAKLGSNYRFSEEKVKAASLFITKLWNISRFISQFPEEDEKAIKEKIDLLFLKQLGEVMKTVESSFEILDPFDAANSLRDYTWNILADHYLELVKPRLYSEEENDSTRSARATVHKILKTILVAMHPIIPAITFYIFQKLYNKDITSEKFPEGIEPISSEEKTLLNMLMEADSKIWAKKKELRLSLNSPLEEKVMVSKSLEPFLKDIKAAHKLVNVEVLDKDVPDIVLFSS